MSAQQETERAQLREESQLLIKVMEAIWLANARRVIWSVFLAVSIGIGISGGMAVTLRNTARRQLEITRTLRDQVEVNQAWVMELRERRRTDEIRYQNLIRALENARRRLEQAASKQ